MSQPIFDKSSDVQSIVKCKDTLACCKSECKETLMENDEVH